MLIIVMVIVVLIIVGAEGESAQFERLWVAALVSAAGPCVPLVPPGALNKGKSLVPKGNPLFDQGNPLFNQETIPRDRARPEAERSDRSPGREGVQGRGVPYQALT